MKKNVSNVIFLVLIASVMLFFSFSYVFVPASTFSENENRALQTSPKLTVEKLLDGTYTRQLHDYFSDQINLRGAMIELKATVELAMGKNESNGILLGKDGYLIETHQYTEDNYSYLRKNLTKIEKLIQSLSEVEVSASSVLIPRKVDVLNGSLPPYYSDARNKDIWDTVSDIHVTLNESLSALQGSGTQIFYKTDHHWTAEGAYYAYCELGEILGYSPLPLNSFDLQLLSDSFVGTTYSKSGFFFVDGEEIKAPSIENGSYKVTVVDTDTELDSLYDLSYLTKKDKYSTFLSGNNAHVKIYDTSNSEKETLLIIKDSFSHSLAPYLCEHYNLEMIDPRYYSGSIEEYIEENNIKNVLFLFGIDTLSSANLIIR